MNDREASKNYDMVEFVKGLYRVCYDNLCLAEKVRIPIEEYMGEDGKKRYRELLKEMVCGVEELSDMLWMMGEEVWEGDE